MQHPDHVVLQSHLTNENHYIFTTGVLMATKLGWIVAHFIGLLPIKLHDPWSRDLMRLPHKLKALYLHYHSAYGQETW